MSNGAPHSAHGLDPDEPWPDEPWPDEPWPDEPWEAEIGSLLGRLPVVEPPEGFLAAAVDRRPMRGGRTLVGLAALVLVVGIAIVGTNLVERTLVSVELDTVVANLDVEATVGGADSEVDRPAPTGDRGDEESLLHRLTVVADAVTRQLGFPGVIE